MNRLILLFLLLAGHAWAQVGNGYTPPATPVSVAPANGGTGAISITQAPYNAIADTIFLTDGTVAASSTAFSSASATFTKADIGKKIYVQYAGSAGALLSTTIAGFVDSHDVTLTAAATVATPSVLVKSAAVATSQSGAGSYAPADTVTVSGGTTVTTASVFTVSTTQLASATVNNAGGSGTNGACTLTGTTGTGTKFQIAATISGNVISALGAISVAGSYTVNPTNLAAEPVTSNCSLVGATLTVKMGVLTFTETTAGLYGALPSNPVSTTTSGSGTGATLTLTSGTAGGQYTYNTDNGTAIGNAITAAVAAGVPLLIPASSTTACYGYTPPLTISGNLQIIGNSVTEQWGGGINVPLTTPQLIGSVLCPAANGSDAIDISGTSLSVPISDLGILWQQQLGSSGTTTGDCIHYVPSSNVQGLSGSLWKNVKCYGHDGNHYAFNLTNPLVDTFIETYSYGGGVFKLYGNASSTNYYGNSVLVHPYGQVIAGGSANGFDIEASGSQRINLMSLIRPQAITDNVPGVSPPSNPPTSSQSPWYLDQNVQTIVTQAPDFETNVNSSITLGSAGNNNVIDYSGGGLGNVTNINAAAWGVNGILFGPRTRTWTDTTSSGATGNTGIFVIPGTHVNATNSSTYAVLASLYVAPPICGTNCAATSLNAIYATGQISTTSSVAATGGAFLSGGSVNLNKNSSTNTTEIGDGTTSGTVTIGGGSNTTTIGSTLSITGVSTSGTIAGSVCMTSANLLLYESGATGCTISLAALKNIDGTVPVSDAWRVLDHLDPIVFSFKDGDGHKQLGFTAENVHDADPRLSTYDGNGKLQAYDPNGMIAVLVTAVQDQQRQIDTLRVWLILVSGAVVVLGFLAFRNRRAN